MSMSSGELGVSRSDVMRMGFMRRRGDQGEFHEEEGRSGWL